jgi:ribosomal protein S18 acetylase RimI-like enzyme
MTEPILRTIPSGPERDHYLPLLYLADDSVEQVSAYYQIGDLYVFDRDDGAPLAITLVVPEPEGGVELKAVAVDSSAHGQGIGSRMLTAVLAALRASGVHHVVVGTGNSGIGQLAFYQKAGFRLQRIERDFFSTARGYPDGLEENGIPLRDMVWMDQQL